MTATLLSIPLSHPAMAARLMLEHKGIEHEVVDLLPGMHPLQVRARGFRHDTVPALKLDGRRVQGSREIARALEAAKPDPPLFPADPGRRREVEEVERWGEAELQMMPRRLFRWGAVNERRIRMWVARDVVGMPGASVMAELNRPVAAVLARRSGAGDAGVRDVLRDLPAALARVDSLLEAGTVGGPEPNAADFQILTTVRGLLTFADLRDVVERYACAAPARALWPDAIEPVPAFLPANWLEPLRA